MNTSEDSVMKQEMQNVLDNIRLALQLQEEKTIRDAFDEGEKFLSKLTWEIGNAQLHSVLGNTCTDLFHLFELKGDVKNIPVSDNLQKAKAFYRQALHVVKNQATYLEKQIWVNFGNCLDFLGRGVEALYTYEEALKIDPKFAMAIGNKALASRYFASISGSYEAAIYIDAYQALQSIMDDKELVDIGGLGAKQHFEAELENIKARFTDKEVLEKLVPHPHYDDSNLSDFEISYIHFCILHKLFLNFHIHDETCKAAISDPIFISITTPIDDRTTFFKLARYINQIKEDYVVARLLLVQSQSRRDDYDSISRRTTFVNPLDYSQTNIYNGLLKSAFKEAYNILDKIAVFLNNYYTLGFKENSIYYDTIWVKDIRKDLTIREEILNTQNMSLYALYDIFKDFQSGHFKQLKNIRHALTHRQLTIFESGYGEIKNDGKLSGIGSDEMLQQTIQLMRLVKAAIIYLINAVTLEERKKNKNADKRIVTLSINTTQLF